MIENLADNTTNITSRSAFSRKGEEFTSCSVLSFLAKSLIPYSHRKIADAYVIIKRIFKFQAVMPRISNVEKALLNKYNFNTLENTTADKMYEELALLQQWSQDESMKEISDSIMEIRAKELKYIVATGYGVISNEIYKGYMVLENYFNEISKYSD